MAINWIRALKCCTQRISLGRQPFVVRKYYTYAPTSELIERRSKLVDEVQKYAFTNVGGKSGHLIVLPAAEIQYMAFHVPYPFHQDSNYFYFTGLNEPNSVLTFVVHTDETNSTYESRLFVDIKDQHAEIWDGPSIGLLEASLLSGIEDILPLTDFKTFVKRHIRSSEITHLWYTPFCGKRFEQRPFNNGIFRELIEFCDELRSRRIVVNNPDILVDNLRVVKSPFEIEQLRNANQLTVRALKSTMAISTPNISEFALFNHIDHEIRSAGSLLSYPPVIAGGHRTNIIHYLKSNKDVKDGDLVLIDVGCKVNGYTSDITRTWPVNGRFSPPQSILYDILFDIQKSCIAMASPEVNLSILYGHMLHEIRRHLVNERIIPTNTDLDSIRKICPHHIGHYLGLDVHDTPTISYERPLSPGTVFPLEPGIYFRREFSSIGFLKEFCDLGMRLEDDFVIGESGTAELLADGIPKGICDLEKLIGSQLSSSKSLHA